MRRDVSEKPRSAKSSSAASSMRSTVSDCAILLSMPLTNVCLKHTFDTPLCQAYLGMTATVQEIRDVYRYRSGRSEEHTSELQSRPHLVCRLLLEKKNNNYG